MSKQDDAVRTFSRGQGRTDTDSPETVPMVGSDEPVWMPANETLGAKQPSSGLTLVASEPSSAVSSSTASLSVSPTIPGGARFKPDLKLGVAGRSPRLKTRQLWEGTVKEVLANGFVAVLRDKTNPTNPDEQATFDFDNTELSSDDCQLVSPGASFYWIIGNERTNAGQVKNISMVQFRRLPAWTQRTLERVSDRARQIRAAFQQE